MPEAISADWEAIRKDRVDNSMSYKDLGEKYGIKPDTIIKRANRYGWQPMAERIAKQAEKEAKVALKAHIASALQQVKPQADAAINAWVERSRNTAGKLIQHVSQRLDNECPPPEDLQRLAGALDRADSIGRRGYGLDKQDPAQAVRVNISMGMVGAISHDGAPISVASDGLQVDYARDETVLDVESQDVA